MPADPTPIRDLLRNLRDDCGHHDAPETRAEAEAALAALDALERERQRPVFVWLVSRGEYAEGSTTRSVHSGRKGAEAAAREIMESETWNTSPWKLAEDAVHTVTWARGCDYVQIERFEVSP